MLDTEALALHAEITHVKPQAKSWENVAIGIYCLKERNVHQTLSPAALSLTAAETPKYFSIKNANHTITRISNGDKAEKVVVNINGLPARFNYLRNKYGAGEYRQEDMYFSKSSYRILDEEDIEALLPEVKEVTEVADILNQKFTEIRFDFNSSSLLIA